MTQRSIRWDYRIHRETFLQSLGYKNSNRIPLTENRIIPNCPIVTRDYTRGPEPHIGYFITRTLFTATVTIVPTPEWSGQPSSDYAIGIGTRSRKSSKHRVFIECPGCEQAIPYGRLHQHVGTATCYRSICKRLGLDANAPHFAAHDKAMDLNLNDLCDWLLKHHPVL